MIVLGLSFQILHQNEKKEEENEVVISKIFEQWVF